MSGIEIANVRVGDEVTVRGVVTRLRDHQPNEVTVHFCHDTSDCPRLISATIGVPAECLVGHTPQALSVGDEVLVNGASGSLVAIELAKYLLFALAVVAVAIAIHVSGEPTCADLRGIENCSRAAR